MYSGSWFDDAERGCDNNECVTTEMTDERSTHIDPTDELAGLIEDLHDSGINGEIGWFSDGVWRAKIGDPWNGYVAEKDGLLSLGQAVEWLPSKTIELYPNSEFAKQRPHGSE
jgi:hypothetical protein